MRTKIEDKLLELGLSPNIKGFFYIRDSVEYILREQGCSMLEVYQNIAEKNHIKDWRRVERATRYALTKIDAYAWHSMGGAGLKSSEFLYAFALIVSRKE